MWVSRVAGCWNEIENRFNFALSLPLQTKPEQAKQHAQRYQIAEEQRPAVGAAT